MGLLKKFFNQTRKPEGALGRMMLSGMNSGHAKLADWGMELLPEEAPAAAADLGCGAGRNVAELLRRYPAARVTAVDHSELAVKKTLELNSEAVREGRCEGSVGDVSDLRLPEGSFGIVTAFETVYFWPGLEKCFSQVQRIMQKGGYFLICNESDGLDSAGKKFESVIEGMTCYTASQLEEALRCAGFSEVASDHHPSKPWIRVLARK